MLRKEQSPEQWCPLKNTLHSGICWRNQQTPANKKKVVIVKGLLLKKNKKKKKKSKKQKNKKTDAAL